jgi:hypothetical protein
MNVSEIVYCQEKRVSQCCKSETRCEENYRYRSCITEYLGTYYVCEACGLSCEVDYLEPDEDFII